MAEKKSNNTKKKTNVGRPPTLSEKITDFSLGASTNVKFVPKQKKK